MDATDPKHTDKIKDDQTEVDIERLEKEEADLRAEIEELNKAYIEERGNKNLPNG